MSNVPNNNWKDDWLDRKVQANYIKRFLDSQYDYQVQSKLSCTYTINIDARWGFGKTFFLNNWKKDLEDQGHWVVYYNAWANDYSMDPLASLIVEITEQLESLVSGPTRRSKKWRNFQSSLKNFLNSWSTADYIRFGVAATSSVLAFPIILPGSDSVDVRNAVESVEESFGSISSAFSKSNSHDALDRERDRRNSLREFQSALKEITNHLSTIKSVLPIYVFIDELDRCKPDFTIGLIECVKHILSIDHMYFVFATDGGQLQNAIHGSYGERFDAELYFKKVFDRDIALVEPDVKAFSNALCARFGYDFLHERCTHDKFATDREGFVSNTAKCFYSISMLFNLSLRDQEQAFSILDSIVRARSDDDKNTNVFFVSLIVVLWLKKKSLFFFLKNNPNKVVMNDFEKIEGFSEGFLIDIEYFYDYRKVSKAVPVWDICAFHISFLAQDAREFKKKIWDAQTERSNGCAEFLSEYDDAKVSMYTVNPMKKYFDEVSLIG